MASNTELNVGTSGDVIVTKERTHDGDASKQQGVFLSGVTGTEGAYTFTDIQADGGTEANALRVTIANDSTGVVSVDNDGTFAVQVDGDALTALQLIDDTVVAQGAALGSTKNSLIGGSVTTSAPTYTNGQVNPLSLDTSGALRVTVENITSSLTDDAAFTPGSGEGLGIFAAFDDTTPDSVDEGDAGILRMSANRNLYSTIRDAAGNERGVNVNASNELTVKATDSDALLTTIDADTSSMNTDLGTLAGAVSGAQFQVDIAADSTAGLATSALQTSGNSSLTDIETNTDFGATTGNGTATGALRVSLASDSTGQVALATGSNAIGKLAANSGVDIGDVDVTSIAAGSNLIGDVGLQPRTSGGISTVYRDEDIDETAVAAKASAGQVYWIHCINLDATPVYLHFYDVAQGSVTVGTTAELMSFAVPSSGDANGAGFNLAFPHGIQFSTAITIACTTTIGGTAGPGANEVILNVGYE